MIPKSQSSAIFYFLISQTVENINNFYFFFLVWSFLSLHFLGNQTKRNFHNTENSQIQKQGEISRPAKGFLRQRFQRNPRVIPKPAFLKVLVPSYRQFRVRNGTNEAAIPFYFILKINFTIFVSNIYAKNKNKNIHFQIVNK